LSGRLGARRAHTGTRTGRTPPRPCLTLTRTAVTAIIRIPGPAASAEAPDLMFWLSDPRGDPRLFEIDVALVRLRSRGSVRLRLCRTGFAETGFVGLLVLFERVFWLASPTRVRTRPSRVRVMLHSALVRSLSGTSTRAVAVGARELGQYEVVKAV
jgi:hypothetical protein